MRICKIEEKRTTLSELMEKFLNVKKANKIAPRTMRDYEHYLKDFLEASRNSTEFDVLCDDVVRYFSAIPDTSPARYNHPYQCLNALFTWAVNKDKLPKNPFIEEGLKKKKDEGNIKPASIDDIKILLNSFDKTNYSGLRNYVITLLMLDTGMRTSELIRLKDTDYDEHSKQITISKHICKTRTSRVVYLSSSTANELSKFIKIKPEGWSEWLFPTREGNQLRTEGLDLEFNRLCKKIGVKITPYQIRHTFATYFVSNGGDVFTLQDLMGHSDIRMTRRYTEIDGTARRKAHNTYTPINELHGKPRYTKIKNA